jgi:hypothetical protein
MMDGFLYETSDKDAGEFKYFFMMPDTPESTYHIEFRYGSDIDALAEYDKGEYAYWLAAGILSDYDDKMIDDVIGLFAEENLSDTDEEESSDKIEISTAKELSDFAKSVSDGSEGGYAGKTVVLTDDIDCTVNGEITGAVTPGAVAGRAENSVIESCKAEVTLDGAELTDEIGKTDKMYESADQEGAEEAEGTQEAEKKDAA